MECKNKVEIRGRVGYVRIRKVQGAGLVDASLTVCVSDVFKGADGSAIVVDTWFSCTWYKVPDADAKLLRPGATVELEGRMRNIHYTTSEGLDKTVMELVATTGRVLKEEEV